MDYPPISKTTSATLRQLGSATIYEAQGAKGALDSGIKPLDMNMRVAGPAFTVDIRPGDNLMLHYALLHIKAGDVLVVDAKGFVEAGPWGDVLTEQALKQGVAGLIINGAVRDAEAIVNAVFPVFCRGLSIKGTGKNQPGLLNVPVCFGDVLINPGDIVVGDRDGVVVVARNEIDDVLLKSQQREDKEAYFREQIREGATTSDLLDLRETLERLNLR
ncbi:4-carboxy-4-hydroxy-2-oxoadipate aldolase/oxaloacetate decarboxylase [Stutzerimonas stutzeri]|uniref:4-carboxy-4-hydroxy-2-oxoadipate aldolase/oxaloacetate decarboxylase n=1 Tax=Stutzerimonas stutzeri TaxID=316 RepID=UPI00190F54C1|nr:4-carboxy-4-hydroxy-2-oxoadipate aldolase/oxaloacetate decarboxylase [Stutzerimonas stutzeri]MCQ4327987.1 4-carboxy-4-hydroxy-2-oxoadipate aldolase/oxaloacetate decarboxylase [Stutzerimonas stutzeri]